MELKEGLKIGSAMVWYNIRERKPGEGGDRLPMLGDVVGCGGF